MYPGIYKLPLPNIDDDQSKVLERNNTSRFLTFLMASTGTTRKKQMLSNIFYIVVFHVEIEIENAK